MDASHVMVGGLTAVSLALLVWVEIRSRRNSVAQESSPAAPVMEQSPARPDRSKPGLSSRPHSGRPQPRIAGES